MPYLIAATPRAGIWNHRLLVAHDLRHEFLDLYDLVKFARKKSEGKAWISVSRSVKQLDSERQGTEILILGDVDVSQLKVEQIKKIEHRLKYYLENDLNDLITRKIDWKHEGKADPLIRKELSAWILDFNEMSVLPSNDKNWNLTLREKQESSMSKKSKKLASRVMETSLIVAALIALGLASGTAYQFLKEDTNNNSTSKNETKDLSFFSEKACDKVGGSYPETENSQKTCKIPIEQYNKIYEILDLSEKNDEKLKEIVSNYPLVFESFSEIETEGFNLNTIVGEQVKIEITGDSSGTPHISAKQFSEIRDYMSKIKKAGEALLAFYKAATYEEYKSLENLLNNSEWSVESYDQVLKSLQNFTQNVEKIIKKEKDKLKQVKIFYEIDKDFFDTSNKKWIQMQESITDPEDLDYKFIQVYKAIMELEPPNIENQQ